MNSEILFKNIFDRDLLQEDSPEYIEELQAKYPWFALAHFYKLKNTGIGHKDYNKQAALTAQFFPNIYILNQRLHQKKISIQSEVAKIIPAHQEHEMEEPQPVIEPVTENIPVTQEAESIIPEVQEHENEEPQPVIEPVTENTPVTQEAETITPDVQEHENEESQPVMEPVTDNSYNTQEVEKKSSYMEEEIKGNKNTDSQPVTEKVTENSSAKQEIENNENTELSSTESVLGKAAADFKKAVTDDGNSGPEAMLFEPLHATDYFASQGIKLSEELQSKDKLGKQMKSFTAWLKVMKKTPEQQQGLHQVADEAQIQNLANKSNTEAEVLTESMADVYQQQGKKEKAREIYKKLSLINPDKSAYFAAKIENLNKK